MIKHFFEPRDNYRKRLSDIGFYHYDLPSGEEQEDYWKEGNCYIFSESQIDLIEETTQELYNRCLDMVAEIVKSGDYPDYFCLDDLKKATIEQSWNRGDKSLYGRFDLVYDYKTGSIKMLELNGDTPVSILEASVAQWDYIQEAPDIPDPLRIQFNMLHENLIETWQRLYQRKTNIHFTYEDSFRSEDFCNLAYLMETAHQAGMNVKEILLKDIGVYTEGNKSGFVDLENVDIKALFKLYPWEWLFESNNRDHIKNSMVDWLEPPWKALLSNKGCLVKLHEMFPNHSNIVPAFASQDSIPKNSGIYVKKAIHGREGANIFFYDSGSYTETLGQGSVIVPEYHKWGYIYQEKIEMPVYDGFRPILGSWIIGDKASGMSVREDKNLVTGDDSFFASHIFIPHEYHEEYKHLLDDAV